MKEIGKQKIFYWINLREKEKAAGKKYFFFEGGVYSVFCLLSKQKKNEIDWLSPN